MASGKNPFLFSRSKPNQTLLTSKNFVRNVSLAAVLPSVSSSDCGPDVASARKKTSRRMSSEGREVCGASPVFSTNGIKQASCDARANQIVHDEGAGKYALTSCKRLEAAATNYGHELVVNERAELCGENLTNMAIISSVGAWRVIFSSF